MFDVKLGDPNPGDWLESHEEPGQPFDIYIKTKPVSPDADRNKIYLLPIGHFTPQQQHVIETTREYLQIFFDRECLLLKPIEDTIVRSSARRLRSDNHEQLFTGAILSYLERNVPADGFVVMAITTKDLYPSPKWNFVFGQAKLKERVGVSSMYRYCGEALDTGGTSDCIGRMIKTSSHEIGHMLGCLHCTNAICVMNGSNSLGESDLRPNRLCSDCHRKLQWNLGFGVKQRLIRLKEYFAQHGLDNDLYLTSRDIEALEN